MFIVYGSFLPSWIRIRIWIVKPDPGTTLNPDPIQILVRIQIHNTVFYCITQSALLQVLKFLKFVFGIRLLHLDKILLFCVLMFVI
jgi:hypothetical protein